MKNIHLIPLAILAAGAILASAVYFTVREEPSTASGYGNPAAVRPVDTTDHILGNPNAPLQIIEYADFDCEFCKGYDAALHQIISDYGASSYVAWIFRDFTLTELHPNAKKHAEAAACVAQTAGNVAYWKFADSLFANQPTDPLRYSELAKAAGADPEAVAKCIQSASTSGIDARIDADRQNAIDSGARGTPYSLIVITGKAPIVIDGAWSYDDLKSKIDDILRTTLIQH